MTEAKIKKLSWKQYALLTITVFGSIILMDIYNRFFHFSNSNFAHILGMIPSMIIIPCGFVCRNLERKPFAQECKDARAVVIACLLTCWIPLIILASIFHIDSLPKGLVRLSNYPDNLVIMVSLLVFGTYGLAFTILLRKFGYCSKPAVKADG